MNTNTNLTIIKDTTSNPAPLGLLGFSLTTILLNLHNAGYFELDAMIMGMGIFIGGMAQVIVGYQEWKKNNTFGAVAFSSYGFFWIILVAIWILPNTGWGVNKPSLTSMGWFLTLWGVYSLFMYIGTLKMNKVMQIIFGSLTILFFLLAAGDFAESKTIKIIAGYEGIFCGLSAFYCSMAQILNEVYGKTVMPLGAVVKK